MPAVVSGNSWESLIFSVQLVEGSNFFFACAARTAGAKAAPGGPSSLPDGAHSLRCLAGPWSDAFFKGVRQEQLGLYYTIY